MTQPSRTALIKSHSCPWSGVCKIPSRCCYPGSRLRHRSPFFVARFACAFAMPCFTGCPRWSSSRSPKPASRELGNCCGMTGQTS